MCAGHREFGSVSHATDRPHLAAFILPSRSLVPSAQFPVLKLRVDRSGLRRNSIAVIAECPRLVVLRQVEGRSARRRRFAVSRPTIYAGAARRMQTHASFSCIRAVDEKWRLPPRNCTLIADCGVFALIAGER